MGAAGLEVREPRPSPFHTGVRSEALVPHDWGTSEHWSPAAREKGSRMRGKCNLKVTKRDRH